MFDLPGLGSNRWQVLVTEVLLAEAGPLMCILTHTQAQTYGHEQKPIETSLQVQNRNVSDVIKEHVCSLKLL